MRAAQPAPRVVIVSFPHNPTTAIATPELMQRLVDLAREREFVLVHDFAYADIAFDGHEPPSVLEGALECAVELYSLTKSFSMAGWRMGFTLGRPDVVAALAKLKSYLDYGTFQPIQIASIVALREAAEYPVEVCEIYRSRRDALCSGLARAGWHVEPPQGTMFVWAPDPGEFRELGSLEFALKLAREADVAVSPGIGFGQGGDGHVRFARDRERSSESRQLNRGGDPFGPDSAALQATGVAPFVPGLFMRSSPFRRRADERRVLRKSTSLVAGLGPPTRAGARSSSSSSRCRGSSRRPRRDPDDLVAVAHGRERAAAERLGRDVADHQAVRRAREAAVGDQRDLVAEPFADERRGHVQHLAHAGAAGRALVADHDDVAPPRSGAP